ncbi:6-phosphogluconolactonase [Catenuloplanes nepalensis]|uniref:6-phosphogluconolactonase n=1 Tax=Catenuloplanes nepalensis TaxID=587533 RepID=A0ABT9MM61_9ACTN|nr:6-phosphogluconolactonase [Catenuloplanes nepalensis]MDP9792126.1 6-phosphogluconolactonase [Catenuloplanes nepalensis]
MTDPTVIVHADADIQTQAVAARLIVKIIDAQAARGTAGIVLTGGRGAAKIYRAIASSPAATAIDWSRVDLWWGDERFLPLGHADRNETQAREALLDALPLDPKRIHPMPPSDGPDGDDAPAAAARYAAEWTAAAPHIDVVLLGVGEDGHVASLFPGHPGLADTAVAAGIHNSPKPPPTRITLTFPTINAADEVWLIVTGADKATPVATALRGGSDLPCAQVHGTSRTLWLIDKPAATDL